MSLILLINNLSTDQHSSGIKPHIMIFAMLDLLWKIVPTSKMQLAISRGESVEILIAQHWTIIFRTYYGSGKLMARQSIFSPGSPPVPKFIAFSDIKYFFHTIWYCTSPAMVESPNFHSETVVVMKLDPTRFIITSSCIQSHQKYSQT